ncbi:MAG TPA: hypothetical protein ENN19_06950 [Chloroflexi bacterium]|nr:hypothetical protein [Chloroflexota bacterium]
MIQRKTQDPTYWSDEFAVTANDLQYLSTILVDDELPRSVDELSQALILHLVQQEKNLVERALVKGTPYQPKSSYEIGESVVFPALDYRVGEVVAIRPGYNPEYGSFQVIEVKFEQGKNREFAAFLEVDHSLNYEQQDEDEADDTDLHTPEELVEMYRSVVAATLEQSLESDSDFIRLAGEWFRRDLLVEVNVGHLNLAEALLDMADGGPMSTETLLGDLELPEEISPQLRTFSLNYALQVDERFDEVGPAGEVLWYLRRMEPEAVQTTPVYLQYEPIDYNPAMLTSEMLALEHALDDEWSTLNASEDVSEPVKITLTYPHRKSGTLPLSARLRHIFPMGRTHRIRFTLVDAGSGDEMPAWVVRKGRYIYGLEEWYETHDIPIGAYLEFEQGDEPGKIVIRQSNPRSRREWIRVALPIDGRLTFEMRKQLITCEYNEQMIIGRNNSKDLDAVWERAHTQDISLEQLISEIFPQLAKLSPQGTVHAATLYSAINLAVRTPPGPMLAALVDSGTYSPVGDNYWVLRARA